MSVKLSSDLNSNITVNGFGLCFTLKKYKIAPQTLARIRVFISELITHSEPLKVFVVV